MIIISSIFSILSVPKAPAVVNYAGIPRATVFLMFNLQVALKFKKQKKILKF